MAIVIDKKKTTQSTTKSIKRDTIAIYNKEIDNAVKRVREGKSISNEQVMYEMETW